MQKLTAISPIDGRYQNKVKDLSRYFSEMALMHYRVLVEVEYFIALSLEKKVAELPPLSLEDQKKLRSFYKNFSIKDTQEIKDIETTTNHDVKAVEYFFRNKIKNTPLERYSEFIHFAITSEDVNNLAYSLMWKDGINRVYFKSAVDVFHQLKSFAIEYRNQPMLSLTHGQSATPTTVGKEFTVFASRLKRQLVQLKHHKLLGKFSGATGTWSAQHLVYPNVDWIEFSKNFVESLGLKLNTITVQIEPHDSLAESYDVLKRINVILTDFCRDAWMYISRGIFAQKKKESEVGSSTMPHKINPIQFENAEGNLGLANVYLSHLAEKLPISRMQRDLSDSTVLRNQGVALAHSLLACKSILSGLSRLTINKIELEKELNENPEVLAEAVQTILRKHGIPNAYEKLKELTHGQKMTLETIREFVNELDIPEDDKQKLLNLRPESYTGLANRIVDLL